METDNSIKSEPLTDPSADVRITVSGSCGSARVEVWHSGDNPGFKTTAMFESTQCTTLEEIVNNGLEGLASKALESNPYSFIQIAEELGRKALCDGAIRCQVNGTKKLLGETFADRQNRNIQP